MATMYAAKEGTTYVLRQTRYREQLASGCEHPHDTCAVANSARQLQEMVSKHWPDADFSALQAELAPSTVH